MITWLVGDDSFEVREALRRIEGAFEGVAEHIDGSTLSTAQLPDLLMGISLFATERLVVISDLTQNSTVWTTIADWLPRVSGTIHLVLIDTKPDKRTSSYKALKAAAQLQEFAAWAERDTQQAEQWVGARAKEKGVALDAALVRHLVARVGLDKWQLAQALEILALFDTVTAQTIDDSIAQNLHENIFQLFETALAGDAKKLGVMLDILSVQEDPYALFALLSSQAVNLAAIAHAGDADNPTKDFAIHPFVASKLSRAARTLGVRKVNAIIESFARTDADLKRSKGEPWLLLRRTLLEVTQQV